MTFDRANTPEYFLSPDVAAFRDPATPDAEKKRIVRKLSALIGNQRALRIILGEDPEEFAAFYPDMTTETPSTFDTIDAFIEKFAPGGKSGARQGVSPEIAALKEADEDSKEADEDKRGPASDRRGVSMDAKEGKTEPARKEPEISREEVATPAQLKKKAAEMIKNSDYEGALEIITRLNLNNPEKSIYFADQMRFLRKLIKIERLRKQAGH